jgi:CubicO group peptidase (beta-lactamase class C family)
VADPRAGTIALLLQQGLDRRPRPLYAGAVCGVDDGERVELVSGGSAYRYADAAGTLLPERDQQPVADDTLFDLASLTKLFTATVVVLLAEQGLLGLDDPLARYFPTYRSSGREAVTVRQLLTHTSGLPADIHFWRDRPDPAARREAVLAQPLDAAPGTRSRYSCVGYLTLGLLVEQLLAVGLDVAVQDLVCRPLGMTRTGYRPLDRPPAGRRDLRDAIAATEMRRIEWSPRHDPNDPDPRGVVHDENAASLGGVAGNAGLFGPAGDLLVFGRALLDALTGDPAPRWGLSPSAAREMVRPQLPDGVAPGYQSGLGFRIDDGSFMGRLAGRGRAYGHTGFTGTSLVVDEARNLVSVLVTNRVHPSRTWSTLNPFRQQLADLLAVRHPVRDAVS